MPKRLIYLVCLGLLLGLVGSVQDANAAVTVGEDTRAIWVGGSSNVMSFNWAAGTDSCLVVMVAGEWDPVTSYVTDVNFGTQALTQAVASPTGTGGSNYADIWYLVAPDGNSGNITVTLNQSRIATDGVIEAVILHGVDQTNPLVDTAQWASGDSSVASVDVNAVVGGILIDSLEQNKASRWPEPYSGQTVLYDIDSLDGTCYAAFAYRLTTAPGPTTESWSLPESERVVLAVASFRPSVGPDLNIARIPNPEIGEGGVVRTPTLSWTAGDNAASVDGHRVYFDPNEQKVIDRSGCDVNGVSTTDPCYPITSPLDLGTYYWAVDEVNGLDVWEGDVWNFTVDPDPDTALARDPNPVNNKYGVVTDPTLSWTPGDWAASVSGHRVYFDPVEGEVIDRSGCDVNDVSTTDPCYPIAGPLGPGTYYWAVDEVNGVSVWEGDVWEFTVLPPVVIIASQDFTGTTSLGQSEFGTDGLLTLDQTDDEIDASKGTEALQVGDWDFTGGGENIVGYLNNGSVFTVSFDARVNSLPESPRLGMRLGQGDTNEDRKMIRIRWQGTQGAGVFDLDVASGDEIITEFDVGTYYHYDLVCNRSSSTLADYFGTQDLDNTDADLWVDGVLAAEDIDLWDGVASFGSRDVTLLLFRGGNGDSVDMSFDNFEVRDGTYVITSDPFASVPNPDNDDTGVVTDPILSWTPGAYVQALNEHDVYFGETFDDVSDANSSVHPNVTYTIRDVNSFAPGPLDFGKTYYWRVDEINDPDVWKGTVWNFTTADHLVVDDMEAYTDRLSIRTVWHDGYIIDGVAPSGSNVTVSTESDDRDPRLVGDGPPWPVRGSEAMQFAYDNDGSITIYVYPYVPYTYSADANYYSEIEASTSGPNSLEITRNWTCAKALSLWFYGDSNNDANDTEQMYVALEDADSNIAVVYYDGDMNDIKIEDWQEWNIALQDFNDQGVNLADVNNIYIGFGDRDNPQEGGSGVVFFDDIRLYPTRCVPRYGPYADLTDDCVVDYKDLDVMAGDWLQSDELIPTADPSGDNLVAYYKFEENTNDSSSNGNHGYYSTPPASYVAGQDGNAIDLNGSDQFVEVLNSTSLNLTKDFTIAAWIHPDAVSGLRAIVAKLTGSSDKQYALEIQDGELLFEYELSSNNFGTSGGMVTAGQWQHVAVTIDSLLLINLYIDGVPVASETAPGEVTQTSNPVVIGRRGGTYNDKYFDGIIDDVRIYDKELSHAEVAWLVTEGASSLYIPLDSPAELYTDEAEGDRYVNFKDFAVLADMWLLELPFP